MVVWVHFRDTYGNGELHFQFETIFSITKNHKLLHKNLQNDFITQKKIKYMHTTNSAQMTENVDLQ